jgi:hypothetical protein
MGAMALNELSEEKKSLLKAKMLEMTKAGKSLRQVARVVLKEFNVKLYDDRK